MLLERGIDRREVDKEKRCWRCPLWPRPTPSLGQSRKVRNEAIQLIWGHEGSSG